ncbi:MAG: hypothetical protein MUF22_02325 [Chitinispirillaceae bacterium]|jgi:hypothetical protein|nr:hypothetical protein [Chitinispirillaceae bacterium]
MKVKSSIGGLAFLLVVFLHAQGFCCGGGYVPMPYIPTSSGGVNTPSTQGSFFLIEKGSSSEMFDVKKLHPLFRNIHQTGNERKSRAGSPIADSVSGGVKENKSPVLNLHSIH